MEISKLNKARAHLVLSHPFFGALVLRMRSVITDTLETAATDGTSIFFNEDFIDNLTLSQLQAVLAHEVLHTAFLHHTRMGAREHSRWNMAGDYAINNILDEAGFDLPKDALINKAWANKSAEEIYTLLPEGSGGGKQDPGGCGGIMPPRGNGGRSPSKSELEAEEAEWKVALAQAAHIAKQAGKLPAGLERMIDATLEPLTNWRQELHHFCNTPVPADVTWNRPNRRFIHQGLYLPSRDVKMTGTFVCVIDTSGSVSDKELNEFGSEIKGIVDQMQPEKVYVIYCDAAVNHVDEFNKYDEITFAAHGGGGTDFRPPFHWLEERFITPDALVYLTDGYGTFPDEHTVTYPTLWAINNRNVTPPFGVHIVIDVEQRQ